MVELSVVTGESGPNGVVGRSTRETKTKMREFRIRMNCTVDLTG